MSEWHLQASSSTQLSPSLQEMGSLATYTCLERRVKESEILCLCLWEKPVLKKDNPDQESTDLWKKKLGCLLQTFEQTHVSHLLSQLGFSHLQLVVPVQAQSCSNWVHHPRGLTQISPNPVVYPLVQMKMQRGEQSLSDEAKSWCLMMLTALLPVFSSVGTSRFRS